MTEEQSKKVAETESTPSNPAPESSVHDPPKEDAAEEKSVIPQTSPSPADNKPAQESKALVIAEKTETSEVAEEKPIEGSVNRDAVLAKVASEKRLSLIKAWEESEKSRAENKSHRKLSAISAWENSRKAAAEAELRKIEEQLEKKKAEYGERLKNKIAAIHREAEEKRAFIEAKKGEDFLKAEETAAKYKATGAAPTKLFGCF